MEPARIGLTDRSVKDRKGQKISREEDFWPSTEDHQSMPDNRPPKDASTHTNRDRNYVNDSSET